MCSVLAARKDQYKLVVTLIGMKIGVNEPRNNGNTALHDAVTVGGFRVARELIVNGADMNLKVIQKKR